MSDGRIPSIRKANRAVNLPSAAKQQPFTGLVEVADRLRERRGEKPAQSNVGLRRQHGVQAQHPVFPKLIACDSGKIGTYVKLMFES